MTKSYFNLDIGNAPPIVWAFSIVLIMFGLGRFLKIDWMEFIGAVGMVVIGLTIIFGFGEFIFGK